MLNGFVNVNKPVGATASDVVVKLRKILHQKQIGHLGTLDPGACGVLPVAVGQATKLFDFLTNKQKTYRAFFTFGKTTDTLDSYGKITANSKIPLKDAILGATKGLTGDILQIPPVYSAISIGGERAYTLARRGDEPQLKSRQVTVFSFDFVRQMSDDTYVFDITCSGGTYIRALARDLALAVNSVAYMSGLIRINSGCFNIFDAITFEEIEALGEKSVLDITCPLSDLPKIEIDKIHYKQLTNGVKVPVQGFIGYGVIYCDGQLFGVGKNTNGKLQLDYNLHNAN